MTLIVENGTNVANANSYNSLVTIRAYALARGVTLSAVDATLEAQVFKAMDYIESFRSQFQGVKTYQAPLNTPQSLQFPRAKYKDAPTAYGIFIDCEKIANNVIPQELSNLHCQVIMAIDSGVNFANFRQAQNFIIKKKVGPLETEYAKPSEGGFQGGVPVIESIQDLLSVLFYPCGKSNKNITSRW